MIELKRKEDCCGCGACAQVCPKSCITLSSDNEGFLYPNVDLSSCVNCGLCERVCPIRHPKEARVPLGVFAAINKDEEKRMKSSSGGIFFLLAERVISEGGVVFGARFDGNWQVIIDYSETIEGIKSFMGSKYVQARVGNAYKDAKRFLDEGRRVLFSGTPCLIAGLFNFIRRDYDNLLTADLICHGSPSPGVFRTFLRDELQKAANYGSEKKCVCSPCIPLVREDDELDFKEVKVINFRDKRNGWKKYGFALTKATAGGKNNSLLCSYTRVDKHPYMDGFLKDLYLRPSCYTCPSKGLSSGSDITLGDYWGIETLMPKLDDDKGVSVVIVNTSKGEKVISSVKDKLQLYESNWDDLLLRNPALTNSAKVPANRSLFFEDDGKTFDEKINVLCKVPFSLENTIILWIQRIPHPIRTFAKRILKTLGVRR